MSVASVDRVDAVRRFNRFYTRQIGLLTDRYLGTAVGLTEARVIYELAQSDAVDTADLRSVLGLDAGYLSRVLTKFERRGLVSRRRAKDDRRRQVVRLTAKGRRMFATLDRRSSDGVGDLLAALPEARQGRLIAAMNELERLLGSGDDAVTVRAATLADLGWVLERHAVLYADEHGFGAHFVADVARILGSIADAIERGEPGQQGWIAELGGERVGAVWCVRENRRTARLRLLLVEPWARGAGVGSRLVEDCVAFARGAGYRRMVLFTQDTLAAARRIYQSAGFVLVASHPEESYGPGSAGEEWALDLSSPVHG